MKNLNQICKSQQPEKDEEVREETKKICNQLSYLWKMYWNISLGICLKGKKKIETNTCNENLDRAMEDETEIHKWHIFQAHTHTHNTLVDLFVSCWIKNYHV